MVLTQNALTCVEALEQDVKNQLQEHRQKILTILRPKSYTFVITVEGVAIPANLVKGVQKLYQSKLQSAVTDSLEREVGEVLDCLKRAGYNVSKPSWIERDGATFLVYTFTPDAHKSH